VKIKQRKTIKTQNKGHYHTQCYDAELKASIVKKEFLKLRNTYSQW